LAAGTGGVACYVPEDRGLISVRSVVDLRLAKANPRSSSAADAASGSSLPRTMKAASPFDSRTCGFFVVLIRLRGSEVAPLRVPSPVWNQPKPTKYRRLPRIHVRGHLSTTTTTRRRAVGRDPDPLEVWVSAGRFTVTRSWILGLLRQVTSPGRCPKSRTVSWPRRGTTQIRGPESLSRKPHGRRDIPTYG